MITVLKINPAGQETLRYNAEVRAHLTNGVILDARWEHARRDLGYTVFEPGDHFVEYFYTDQWFNIFAISSAEGQRKGWYCNIAAPALITDSEIAQIDLLLDVWVNPNGEALILDEDEFAADPTLTTEQREQAREGLHSLLSLIAARAAPFLDN
jgi:predicted RNA-binding protein associated with RNAse of E/G family